MKQMRFWTKIDRDWLIENSKYYTVAELCNRFNRSPGCMIGKLTSLDLSWKRTFQYWTKEEEEFLTVNHQELTLQQLNKTLKRGIINISGKIRRMGLQLKARHCQVCNSIFKPKNRNVYYCSRACCDKFHNRKPERKAQLSEAHKRRKIRIPIMFRNMTEIKVRKIFNEYKKTRMDMKEFARKRLKCSGGTAQRLFKNMFPDEWDEVMENKKGRWSRYKKGRQFEYRVRDERRNEGFLVLRSPASAGPFDLICVKKGRVELIQCKIRKSGLAQKERIKLEEIAHSIGAIPILAYRGEGGFFHYPVIYVDLRKKVKKV